MAIESNPRYWSENPKTRLSIGNIDEHKKALMLNKLKADSPRKPNWPYGMPTSANPWLILVGVSPGAAKGKKEKFVQANEYEPSVGMAHQHFNSASQWGKFGQWKGYWPKIRKMCVGLLNEKMGSDEEIVLSVCGHLNLGEIQTGTGDRKAIDKTIVGWIPTVIAKQLRPQVVLLMGITGLIKKGELDAWKGSDLDFIVTTDPHVIPFKDWNSRSKRVFRVWNNPSRGAYPRKVVMLPNHPSRPPLTDPTKWDSMTRQLKKIVFI
jgi:hypothetical protein